MEESESFFSASIPPMLLPSSPPPHLSPPPQCSKDQKASPNSHSASHSHLGIRESRWEGNVDWEIEKGKKMTTKKD
ncbi:hypothetical protein MTR_4g070930 [Medicago truncatula]|uniref:Uncharacterized protein n=1 Tax=Medicago truncatula TaxID=3880 RepID=G7JIJ9_MEDTR|nr:hypothetical protein MTR_4g070930 [Medicago truncatula]